MFTTIIVGIDGRPHDQEALALARTLAGPGATIIVAAVAVDDAHAARRPSGTSPGSLLEAMEELVDQVTEADETLQGVAISEPTVGRGLRDLAAGSRADLIVTGSSRRGLLGRIFAGDHVRDVLRHAPCPVAVTPVGYAHRAGEALHRIGVGYDGSAESDAALALAMELRDRDGAVIDIVEVVEPTPLMLPAGEVVGTTLVADVQRARANLDRIVAETGLTGRVITGSAAHELARLGQSVDLVAIGLHHRGLLDRLLVGSTAHALLREQAAPVLVVPPAPAPAAQTARAA